MRNLRICLYGGIDLKGDSSKFITRLVYTILNSIPGCVIITGGFLYSNKQPTAISTDGAALKGAKLYAEENKKELKDCFEAWIPDPSLDDRSDVKGAVRMKEDQGITVRIMQGRTALGRRMAMVAGVDLVITISGSRHTEVVAEQALELGIPVFPIPHFGGDSQKLLDNYRARIAASFKHNELNRCLETLSNTINKDVEKASEAIVKLINTARLGKCLILLPYDDEHKALYDAIIEPSVAKHMIPIRLDRLPGSESIYTSFADAVRSSSAVIAAITQLNENVMYEIGYTHGRGLSTLIFTQEESRLATLPVYFRTLNVHLVRGDDQLRQLIDDHLIFAKIQQRRHPFGE